MEERESQPVIGEREDPYSPSLTWSPGHTLARSLGYGSAFGTALGCLVCCVFGVVSYAGAGMTVGFVVGLPFGLFGGLLLVATSRWLLRWPYGIPLVSGGSSVMLGSALLRWAGDGGLPTGGSVAAAIVVLGLMGGSAGPRVFFGKSELRRRLVRLGVRAEEITPR